MPEREPTARPLCSPRQSHVTTFRRGDLTFTRYPHGSRRRSPSSGFIPAVLISSSGGRARAKPQPSGEGWSPRAASLGGTRDETRRAAALARRSGAWQFRRTLAAHAKTRCLRRSSRPCQRPTESPCAHRPEPPFFLLASPIPLPYSHTNQVRVRRKKSKISR